MFFCLRGYRGFRQAFGGQANGYEHESYRKTKKKKILKLFYYFSQKKNALLDFVPGPDDRLNRGQN